MSKKPFADFTHVQTIEKQGWYISIGYCEWKSHWCGWASTTKRTGNSPIRDNQVYKSLYSTNRQEALSAILDYISTWLAA